MGDDGSQTSGEVTLVWIEHSKLLTEGIWRSFREKENVDIKLRCQHYNKSSRCKNPSANVNVDAHRLILSILCPNFDINSRVAVSRSGVLNFDLDVDQLNIFFELLYRGQVTLAEKQLGVLRQCAEALRASRVIEIIDEFNISRMSKSKAEEDSYQAAGRRKRKSTPVKLQKTVVEPVQLQEIEENVKENEQELVNDEAEDKSFDNQEHEACDSDVSDDIEEKVSGKMSKNAKSHKKNSEITRNRTAYKRIWRLNQPLQKCSHCDYETRDKESFRNHVNKHDPSAEKFVCRYCEKTFRSKRGFARHQNIHLQPDRIQRCPLCAYLTPLRSTMVQHMGTVHKADIDGNPLTGKYKCSDCDFNCLFECQLKIHLIRKHKKERPFKCNECEYSAVLKSDLDKHVSIVHRLERPYMCEVCGFRSQSQGGYNRHKRVHTGEKPFQCDLCGKQYADSRKHKIHVRRHENDEKPFTCHLCGHSCRRKDNLKMHLKRIHKTTTEVDPMLMVSGEENDQEDQNIVIESIVTITDDKSSVKRLKSSTCNQVEHDNSSELMQQQEQESNITMLTGETVVIYY